MTVLSQRVPARPILGVHPGLILAALDIAGLLIASYLAVVEVGGGVPACGPIEGCEEVALSDYSRIGGVPVAVFGVILSVVLLTCAVAWWRTDAYGLLLAHYGLSLAGVLFEVYFLYLQVNVIRALCVWCTAYGLSLILRFVIAFVIWVRQPPPERAAGIG
ncbi:MAG TPA: vitamin K epoxide reductase family protein [Candidatus Limnocylindrales bacterium]|nr:vitamin K epoxide reductase family protein [Candidatus Limnocylindrales bacterium]